MSAAAAAAASDSSLAAAPATRSASSELVGQSGATEVREPLARLWSFRRKLFCGLIHSAGSSADEKPSKPSERKLKLPSRRNANQIWEHLANSCAGTSRLVGKPSVRRSAGRNSSPCSPQAATLAPAKLGEPRVGPELGGRAELSASSGNLAVGMAADESRGQRERATDELAPAAPTRQLAGSRCSSPKQPSLEEPSAAIGRGAAKQDGGRASDRSLAPGGRFESLVELLDQLARRGESSAQHQHQLAAKPSQASWRPPAAEWRESSLFHNRQQLAPTRRGSQESEAEFYLEKSWSDFVLPKVAFGQSCELTAAALEQQEASEARGNLKIQQDAIWELLTTEVFYMKRIRVIPDLFLATLAALQAHSILLEIDPKRLASNIDEVYQANLSLWRNHLRPMLARSRSTRRPLNPILMQSAFIQIRSIFSPYYRYCLEHSACLGYVRELSKTNECFRVFLAWCESQKECERLRLMDLLAKPMQRLTRYSLLLKAIAKRTDSRPQLAALEQMASRIAHMNKFVLTVDLELRRKEDLDRLCSVARRIDSYESGTDVFSEEVERLARNYCHFELTAPMFNCEHRCHRQLLFDSQLSPQGLGQLKFKDCQASGKLDIVLLIFTDHLFVCKQLAGRWHQASGGKSAGGGGGGHSPARRPSAASNRASGQAHLSLGARSRAGSQSNGLHEKQAATNQTNPPARASSLILAAGSQPQAEQRPAEVGANEGSREQVRDHALAVCRPLLAGQQRQSLHSSSSSLAGSLARDFFQRSTETSKSADQNQEPGQAAHANGGRLRVIRSPYPIERLVMHELRDGRSVFCCQLNDSLTIASSFVLYCSQSSNDSIRFAGQQVGRAEMRSGGQESGRSEAAEGQRERRPSDAGQTSPARRLINLIKEAQVRYQLAANFHGASLVSFGGFVEDRAESSAARAQRSRLSTWSSFRHSRGQRASQAEPSRLLAGGLQGGVSPGSRSLEARSASSENNPEPEGGRLSSELAKRTEPATGRPKQASALLKAVVEQHQCMLLNHAQHDRLSTHEFSYQAADENYLQVAPVAISLLGESCDTNSGAPTSDSLSCLLEPADRFNSNQPSSIERGSEGSVFEEPTGAQWTSGEQAERLLMGGQGGRPSRYQVLLTSCSSETALPNRQDLLWPAQLGCAHFAGKHNSAAPGERARPAQFARRAPLLAGRRHLGRSARLSNNLETSSDNETAHSAGLSGGGGELRTKTALSANASVTSSTSSTRSLSPFAAANQARASRDSDCSLSGPASGRATAIRAANLSQTFASSLSVGSISTDFRSQQASECRNLVCELRSSFHTEGRSRSERKSLNLLRRQKVILSASGEQPRATAESRSSSRAPMGAGEQGANSSAGAELSPRRTGRLAAQHGHLQDSSQTSTLDETSASPGRSNRANLFLVCAHNCAAAAASQQPEPKATSFELGNLGNRASARLGCDGWPLAAGCKQCARAGGRSVSAETRSPVAVTLTLANADVDVDSDADADADADANAGASERRWPAESLNEQLGLDERQELAGASSPSRLGLPRKRCSRSDSTPSRQPSLSPIKSSSNSPCLLDASAEDTGASSVSLDTIPERAGARQASKLRLRPESLRREEEELLPVFNVTSASPVNLRSTCDFPPDWAALSAKHRGLLPRGCNSSSADEQQLCAPDWGPDERGWAANQVEQRPRGSSLNLARKCKTLLRIGGRPKGHRRRGLTKTAEVELELEFSGSRSEENIAKVARLSADGQRDHERGLASGQLVSSKLSLDFCDELGRAGDQCWLSVSSGTFNERYEEEGALLDMGYIGSLAQELSASAALEREQARSSAAYLGFHEKIALYNRLEEERQLAWDRRGRRRKEAGQLDQRIELPPPAQRRAPGPASSLGEQKRRSSSTQLAGHAASSSARRSARTLNLSRSMTGEILGSFLRAKSLRSIVSGNSKDKD